MRIHRLQFGLIQRVPGEECTKQTEHFLQAYEGACFCKFLDIGPFYFTWLSYECMSYEYKQKARLYRVKRYLKKRKQRLT
jgi:hypothetical protein